MSDRPRRKIDFETVREITGALPGVEEATTPSATSMDLPFEDRAPSDALRVRNEATAAVPPVAPAAASRELVLCHVCGDMMQRAGSCYACPSCGSTSGCS